MKPVYIEETLHRQLKQLAAERGLPLYELVQDLVRRFLRPLSVEARDTSTADVTAASAGGGAFDFLSRDEEDIYLPTDGKPLD